MTMTIRASTSSEEIEDAIPYSDMRAEALARRDEAAAVINEQGDQIVLELHHIGGLDVLYSPDLGYAIVNERTHGVGNSLMIGNGECYGPEHAARMWRAESIDA